MGTSSSQRSSEAPESSDQAQRGRICASAPIACVVYTPRPSCASSASSSKYSTTLPSSSNSSIVYSASDSAAQQVAVVAGAASEPLLIAPLVAARNAHPHATAGKHATRVSRSIRSDEKKYVPNSDAPISLCLLGLLMRHRGLPCPSPPSLDQLLPFKCVNVLQSFSVNISQKTFSPLLHIQTPSTASDQASR